ncbi:hypothetical protein [uncultured Aquimarina sp.]|uniref:hypothetical protein n=1 Tax=uncultured Aquimarina sp. TaxID=575652 RepID=UPI002616A082|nr:hypothetical protein [uncultured Aquimarina sp.]
MATQKKEDQKHFTPSNSLIECTGCPCGISNLISTTPTVFVKKKPMATIKDGLPSSFLPFPTCSLSLTNTCIPAPIGEWETQGELKKIDIERQTPIIEGNRIKCQAQTGIGTITISEKTSTPPPPENVVDKAQNKINKAANSVTKKITEVAQDASDAINDIAGGAKKVGGFLKNESIQGAVSNTSNFVDNVDRKKAELDATVGNINIRLENLRKELKELITGEQQELQDLMTVQDKSAPKDDNAKTEEENAVPESNEENKAEEEKEELKYNQDFFDQANQESVNAFLNSIEEDVNTLTVSSEAGKTPRNFETITAENSSTRLFTDEPPSTNTKNNNSTSGAETANNIVSSKSDKENLEEILNNNEKSDKHYTDIANSQYTEANTTLGNYDAEPLPQDEESLQALALLNRLTDPNPPTDSSTIILNALPASNKNNQSSNPFEARINEEKTELNTKVQAEIDEVLNEIKYLERTQKYQQESKELQEDIDRSAAALDVLGDFDAFIDGIAAKHLGRLAGKYKQVMDQMGKNMSRLNDSLRGTSFMTGGFKAGDVVTHAPDLPKEKEEEKEEDTATPVLPPPVTIVDPPPKEKEPEEETPEETDECTFTKLTVIKNKTLEYVVIEKDGDNIIQEQPIDKPISFVAGTGKNTKKDFTIEIKDLFRTSEHKQDQLYYQVDGETEVINFPDGNPELKFEINYNDRFLEENRLLNNFMGLLFHPGGNLISDQFGAMHSTLYNIPLSIPCARINSTININVFPDAEWSLVFSVAITSPIASSFFTNKGNKALYKSELEKADKVFGLKKISMGSGKLKGEIKFAYGVTYNGGKDSLKLEASKVSKAVNIFRWIYKIAEKVNEITDKIVVDEAKRKTGKAYSVRIIPPTVNIIWKNKMKVGDKTIFDEAEKLTTVSFSADPFLAAEIFINLVKTSRKMPVITVLAGVFESLSDKKIEEILTFNVSLDFKIAGNFDGNDEGGRSAKIEVSPALKFVVAVFDKGTAGGIEYEAGIKLEATPAGSLNIASVFSYEEDQWYNHTEVMFNGVEFTFIVHAKASGTVSILWFDDLEVGVNFEEKYSKSFFAWDHPWKSEKKAIF